MAEVAAHECWHLVWGPDEEDAEAYGAWAAGVVTKQDGRHLDLVPNIHAWTGLVRGLTLYGDARPEDVLVAREQDGSRKVWRNRGWLGSVDWCEYNPRCQVPGSAG